MSCKMQYRRRISASADLIVLFFLIFISLRQNAKANTFDDDYVRTYGNDYDNPQGLWREAKVMAWNGSLKDFCARVHQVAGKGSVTIEEASVSGGRLYFSNSNAYNPMCINFVRYKVQGIEGNKYYYITKGLDENSIFYIKPLGKPITNFNLSTHVCCINA